MLIKRFMDRLCFVQQLRTRSIAVWLEYIKLLITNRMYAPSHSGIITLFGNKIRYQNRGSLHGIFKEIFFLQNYNIPETNDPLVIIDCGSNIGLSLLYFRRQAPNASIIGFEPNPHTFEILESNVTSNKLDVTLHNVGVGAESITTDFYTDSEDLSSQSASLTKHLETKNRTLQSIQVKIDTLSQYIDQKVDILKLDIEGAEGDVIEDLVQTDKIKLINKIFIEYHFDGSNTVYPLGNLLQNLERANFTYVVSSPIKFPFTIPNKLPNYSYKITAWRQQQ